MKDEVGELLLVPARMYPNYVRAGHLVADSEGWVAMTPSMILEASEHERRVQAKVLTSTPTDTQIVAKQTTAVRDSGVISPQTPRDFSASQPLLEYRGRPIVTIGDSFEGTLIFGATGSGKTTGSGQSILRAFLRSGFGGLVLAYKQDEYALIQGYCEKEGRTQDLLRFSKDSSLRFNPLSHELTHAGSATENILQYLLALAEITQASAGKSSTDSYWSDAAKRMLRNTIEVVSLATGQVTFSDLYDVISSVPQSPSVTADSRWQKESICFRYLGSARAKGGNPADLALADKYFLHELPEMGDRHRSSIMAVVMAILDSLVRSPLSELFGTTTNVTPEDIFHGKILVCDLPIAVDRDVGKFANLIWKLAFQRAVQNRTRGTGEPCFLWADECQFVLLKEHDFKFQTVARQCRCSTVYLTQNLSNLRRVLGDAETNSLLGNLKTRIFHQNSEPETNEWASKAIGECYRPRRSESIDVLHEGGPFSSKQTSSESVHWDQNPAVYPHEFGKLSTGGKPPLVEGFIHKSGKLFSNKKPFLRVSFHQREPGKEGTVKIKA